MMAVSRARVLILCLLALLQLASAAGRSAGGAGGWIDGGDNWAGSTADSGELPGEADALREEAVAARARELTAAMTLEEKVSQMIMPAIRTWGGQSVTDLPPALGEALRRHQYGGVILFSANITDTAQTVRLIADLQANNAQGAASRGTEAVPYLVAADQEGGSVARLNMGTRGTGSMAVGAAGEEAAWCARATGQVFGEELAALGINVNLGPCLDVIPDLTDAGMSTRVFSDDPRTAAELGLAFQEGVSQSGVITTFKHFPGAGDGSDYPTSIRLTREELDAGGLYAFRAAIEQGAEMIMTSATTFPLLDDRVLMADGASEGYYPATLSPGIVTGLLREELAFDGVVITDALEMEQFITEPDSGKAFFPGQGGTISHDLQVAEKAVNAGCDILLLPADLNGSAAVQYYDAYIAGIVRLVEEGTVSVQRVDEAVCRILELKVRHGLLDAAGSDTAGTDAAESDTAGTDAAESDTAGGDIDGRIEAALQIVGSAEHHETEGAIAAKAVTLLKDDGVLPLPGAGERIVILGRTSYDNTPITCALDRLLDGGYLDADTRIENHISGENRGSRDAALTIVIDRYYSASSGGELLYSSALAGEIRKADAVVCLSAVGPGAGAVQDSSPAIQGVSRALSDARGAGAKFVLLSDNLPVDAARFQDADAIVCAYLSAGFGIDPTARTSGSENVGAFNANVPAALCAIFGAADMPGRLPIQIPHLEKQSGGRWAYSDEILYERGFSASGVRDEDTSGAEEQGGE